MPHPILGTVSKDYSMRDELRSPYYNCTVAHVEPRILTIYAKLLPEAQVAVFGEYEIMILFTYTDTRKETISFLQTMKRTFSELMDVGSLIHKLPTADIADIQAKVTFHPQVTCKNDRKTSCIWNVNVSGTFTVTLMHNSLYAKSGERADAFETYDAYQADNGDALPEALMGDGVQISEARCWMIGDKSDLTFEQLCEMKPEEIDHIVSAVDPGDLSESGEEQAESDLPEL